MINTTNSSLNNEHNDLIEEKTVENKENRPNESSGIYVRGHIKIFDPDNGQVFVDKRNAIHYENFSYALAQSLANTGSGFISEMALGNGGTSVDPTGVITYLPTNTSGSTARLYNQTYYKSVDSNSTYNLDPTRNKLEIRHINGTVYSDIFVTCTLDYGEPSQQQAFDNTTNFNDQFVFDELGLKSWSGTPNGGSLITHVVFQFYHSVLTILNLIV